MHPQNPNEKLEIAIKNSELPSLAKDYTELAIDGLMDDGILKDIPLVGTVIGVMKFGNSLNKHLSAKKLYKFLFELQSIPLEKRIKKIDEINSSEKYQSNVGEMLFELLEKIESDGKPEIIGKLFKAYIEENIDFHTFLRLSHIIKNIFYYDLLLLKNYDENNYLYDGNTDQLESSGLTSFNINAWEKPEPKENCKGEIMDNGKLIVEYGLK
ncbi:Hypothetical protein I595_453 [Croceitalea dokdonensis DOKDO 023]|uniref:Uncharacterized protein n=1 Tax=Croceitalea dokdonensis DOKDO 023 TaxID=1300341 RepID=A0A0P7AIW9_9FLAO|nr:hypothetical protein [Croceitalea dokdonensis]KPM33550.1 Hypothetical protein I595_453 [Croceitalea dokdonensis DOKDO 023]